MDIILVNSKRGHMRRMSIGWLHLLPFVAVVLLTGGTAFYLGQMHTSSTVPSIVIPDSLGNSWQAQLKQQQSKVDDLREQLQFNMQALYQRLGRLQANVTRINAVGQRVTQMAGIKPGEFSFNEEPALGGPEDAATTVTDTSIAEFEQQLDALQTQLDSRERQMQVLRDLVVAGHLRKQIFPAGRPVQGGYITSGFGYRVDPFSGNSTMHKGLDFSGHRGEAVMAVAAGIVTWAGPRGGYGNLVEVTHGNGYVTRYGHNYKVLVKVGQRVSKGQEIAEMGSTGRSTGPHCHFEVRHNGVAVNPAQYIHAAAG